MQRWLQERLLILIVAGAAVPVLLAMCFWDLIRPEWQFWLVCYPVGLIGGIFYLWGRQRGRDIMTRFTRRQRILMRCLALVILWCVLVLLQHGQADRSTSAGWMTVAVAVLWGGYLLFSAALDSIWTRVRRR